MRMCASVYPVVFNNRDGLKLFGIVHQPDELKRKNTAIVLLSPGVKTRVAPHRLYKNMADHFVELGYPVFRFDFYGLGDSEGEIDNYYLADFYGTVGVGRYVNDTRDALDWVEKEYGWSRVVFAGLCGGALTGILEGAGDKRVVGLIGLGVPVVLDSANIDKSKYITQGQIRNMQKSYVKKLLSIKAWLRLLTFKSDLRVIGKILAQPFKKVKGKVVPAADIAPQLVENSEARGNYNSLFTPAFFNMVGGSRKVLFVFSGADRLAWEFEEKFTSVYAGRLSDRAANYQVHTIANANHILSDKKWFAEMMHLSTNWLNTHYSQ